MTSESPRQHNDWPACQFCGTAPVGSINVFDDTSTCILRSNTLFSSRDAISSGGRNRGHRLNICEGAGVEGALKLFWSEHAHGCTSRSTSARQIDEKASDPNIRPSPSASATSPRCTTIRAACRGESHRQRLRSARRCLTRASDVAKAHGATRLKSGAAIRVDQY